VIRVAKAQANIPTPKELDDLVPSSFASARESVTRPELEASHSH